MVLGFLIGARSVASRLPKRSVDADLWGSAQPGPNDRRLGSPSTSRAQPVELVWGLRNRGEGGTIAIQVSTMPPCRSHR
jgi:hypothetical protein